MKQMQSAMLGNPTQTRLVPQLSELKSRSSDVTFAMKIAIYGAAIWIGSQFVLSEKLHYMVAGVIIIGMMFAHGVELQHQVLHNQGFKKRWLNEAVGIFLGMPMLVSYAAYQASHLRHHRLLGTPENKEFFDYGDQYGISLVRSLFIWCKRFLMLSHYAMFVKNLGIAFIGRDYKGESPDVSRRIRRDHLLMFLAIVAGVAASIALQTNAVILLWAAPLLLVATPVHALIEMPEHYRCDTSSTDVFENTRTIKSNAFMYWFTNGNNYHVEHHLMPGLPIDRLHDLHFAIAENIKHHEATYRAFYFRTLFPLKNRKSSH